MFYHPKLTDKSVTPGWIGNTTNDALSPINCSPSVFPNLQENIYSPINLCYLISYTLIENVIYNYLLLSFLLIDFTLKFLLELRKWWRWMVPITSLCDADTTTGSANSHNTRSDSKTGWGNWDNMYQEQYLNS